MFLNRYPEMTFNYSFIDVSRNNIPVITEREMMYRTEPVGSILIMVFFNDKQNISADFLCMYTCLYFYLCK